MLNCREISNMVSVCRDTSNLKSFLIFKSHPKPATGRNWEDPAPSPISPSHKDITQKDASRKVQLEKKTQV